MFNKNATPASESYVHTEEVFNLFEEELNKEQEEEEQINKEEIVNEQDAFYFSYFLEEPVDTEDNEGHPDTVYYTTAKEYIALMASKASV